MIIWIGDKPEKCDICSQPIGNAFVDGKVINSGWAIMCEQCFLTHGIGLGTGVGQLYEKKETDFVKTGG